MVHMNWLGAEVAGSLIIFVGPSGSGKTLLRKHAASVAQSLGITHVEISDYPFIYAKFLRDLLGLSGERRFKVGPHGSFLVDSEIVLRDALLEMFEHAKKCIRDGNMTLVEFARGDNLTSLRLLGVETLKHARIVYAQAPLEVRQARLSARACAPTIAPFLGGVKVALSDDHYMPPLVSDTLYARDDLDALMRDDLLAPIVVGVVNTLEKSDPDHRRRCLRSVASIVRSMNCI